MEQVTQKDSSSALPKRERRRLATAELWLQVAMVVQEWANAVADRAPNFAPFAGWPADDPLRQLCDKYDLTASDLSATLTRIAEQIEARAERAGYADVLDG